MRFVFLDEGGISRHESSGIVCGVVVHGDTQLIPLEDGLDAIIRKHIPEEDQENFVLHAAEIWAGTKYFKDREKWPWEKRSAILMDIAALPNSLQMPIVFSWRLKSEITVPEAGGPLAKNELDFATHVICFIGCVMSSEELMRVAYEDEVAQVVAEDNDIARKTIKGALVLLKKPELIGDVPIPKEVLPLTKIRGPILFANKHESKCLQMADFCTFFVRRRLEKNDLRSRPFYNKLLPMMISVPQVDMPFVQQWPWGPSIVFQEQARQRLFRMSPHFHRREASERSQ